VHDRAKGVATYVAIERTDTGVSEEMVSQNRSRVLFAGARELLQWRAHSAKKNVVFQSWSALADAPADAPSFEELPAAFALPLTMTRGKVVVPMARPYHAKADDVVEMAIVAGQVAATEAWLTEHGWIKAPGGTMSAAAHGAASAAAAVPST
jgi:hypothetical protein